MMISGECSNIAGIQQFFIFKKLLLKILIFSVKLSYISASVNSFYSTMWLKDIFSCMISIIFLHTFPSLDVTVIYLMQIVNISAIFVLQHAHTLCDGMISSSLVNLPLEQIFNIYDRSIAWDHLYKICEGDSGGKLLTKNFIDGMHSCC